MLLPMVNSNYNPDVLNCIANLSNDEVFTPPELANRVLDLLPQDLFKSPDTKFLDPFSKSGVFLREIVKRLDRGLESQMPDRQLRIDHILHNQVFGIAITELTSYLSRRSVYCSKHADGKYSVSHFNTESGNILYANRSHTWENGKCKYCGASQAVYDRGSEAEQYAYMFIHTDNPKQFFGNMKFDVIVGNPPYQMEDGGHGASAIPIYQLFVQQAKKLKPRYLTMIIPARWYAGGRGLDDFRGEMLNDRHLTHIVDYFNSEECFPGIDLSGGVCYFLWERDRMNECQVTSILNGKASTLQRPLLEKGNTTFVRFNYAIDILNKIKKKKEQSFMDIVSANDPFGYDVRVENSMRRVKPTIVDKPSNDSVIIHYWGPKGKSVGYTKRSSVRRGHEKIDRIKVFISRSYGERGDFPYLVIGKPFIGDPGTVCTETYVTVGLYDSIDQANNVISYMRTRFFRFLVMLKKNTQSATQTVYQFVPMQDFSHPWTDEELYKKYGFNEEDIAFIESMIRPME
jgi:site-specific DNA-methyltransferase (adenine-specific)